MKVILAILLAGIMVAAIAVPMAIGDEASQTVTVTQIGALTILDAGDLTTDVTAIAFGSGAPGDALRPTATGSDATFALKNTYNDNVVVELSVFHPIPFKSQKIQICIASAELSISFCNQCICHQHQLASYI